MKKKQLITEREYKFLMELTKREGLDVHDITNNTDINRNHAYTVSNDLHQKGLMLKKKIDRERYFLAEKKQLIKIRDNEIRRISDLFKPLIEAKPKKLVIFDKLTDTKPRKQIRNNFDYSVALIQEVQKWSPSMARRLRKKMKGLKQEVSKNE